MTAHSETALRKSLDAIDSMRNRVLIGGWLAVAVTLGAYWHLYYVERHSDSLERLLMSSVTALTCLIAWAAFAIILIVMRMTKRILRAIDLASTVWRANESLDRILPPEGGGHESASRASPPQTR
jgi:hypothetical protein